MAAAKNGDKRLIPCRGRPTARFPIPAVHAADLLWSNDLIQSRDGQFHFFRFGAPYFPAQSLN